MANVIRKSEVAKSTTYTTDVGSYEGRDGSMPTWSVGTTTDSPKARLGHTLEKWAKLLTIDGEGDCCLMNLVDTLIENAEHHAADSIRDAVDTFVVQYLGWREQKFGPHPAFVGGDEAEESPSEEVLTTEDMVKAAARAMCTTELSDAFLSAVWHDFERSELGVEEYTSGLAEFGGTPFEYMGEFWVPGIPGSDDVILERNRKVKSSAAAARMWGEMNADALKVPVVDAPAAPAKEQEPADDIITPELRRKATNLLSTQLGKPWMNATKEAREAMVNELAAWLKSGGNWEEYRVHLKAQTAAK